MTKERFHVAAGLLFTLGVIIGGYGLDHYGGGLLFILVPSVWIAITLGALVGVAYGRGWL